MTHSRFRSAAEKVETSAADPAKFLKRWRERRLEPATSGVTGRVIVILYKASFNFSAKARGKSGRS
jgi:hypothetical protein